MASSIVIPSAPSSLPRPVNDATTASASPSRAPPRVISSFTPRSIAASARRRAASCARIASSRARSYVARASSRAASSPRASASVGPKRNSNPAARACRAIAIGSNDGPWSLMYLHTSAMCLAWSARAALGERSAMTTTRRAARCDAAAVRDG